MGLFSKWFNRPSNSEYKNRLDTLGNGHDVFGNDWARAGGKTYVSPNAAMQHSAVYACVRVISQIIGSLRIDVLDVSNNKNRNDLELHGLIDKRPNDLITARDLWEQAVIDMLLKGRAYIHIIRDKSGKVLGLIRLEDHNVRVKKSNQRLPKLIYEVSSDYGGVEIVNSEDMLHFRNFGSSNYLGETPIQIAGRSIVAGNTEEEFSQKYFDDGGKVKDIVEFPEPVDREVINEFKNGFNENQLDKVLVLQAGGKHKRLSISAQDSQTLDSRKFSVEQICRLFGTPMVMIGSLDKATSFGKGVAEQYAFFSRLMLNPMLQKIECEMNIKLFIDPKNSFEIQFDRSGLTKGDLEATTKAEQVDLGGNGYPGTVSVNEMRKRKRLEPIDEPWAKMPYRPPEKVDNKFLRKPTDKEGEKDGENE